MRQPQRARKIVAANEDYLMEPFRSLLERLQAALPDSMRTAELDAQLEAAAARFFANFELVPKREYEAHVQIVDRLEARVAELETQIAALEAEPDA